MSEAPSVRRVRVCAVTANWNGLEDTIECVRSLLAQTPPLAGIIVVDNASHGGDADRLVERFGTAITVLRNPTNLGCAGGYNTGIRHALSRFSPDYVLAINNDVVADPRMVAEMVGAAGRDPRIGIVGARIYYYDWHGRKDVVWSAGGTIHRWGLKIHRQRGNGAVDDPEFDEPRDLGWASGAAMLLTPAALRDGGYFNTWYFIGHEDVELCLKASAAGHGIVYAPRAKAWHKVGASAKKVGVSYADPAAYYYLIRHTFPMHVYLYHVALFPLLVARWGILFLVKSRDRAQLRRFITDMKRFVSHGGAA
jgi:GT2 family glycosyltransferase